MTASLKHPLLLTAALLACEVRAADPSYAFDIPAQDLAGALQKLAAQSGKQIFYAHDHVAGRRAPALQGSMTLAEAAAKLLAGTGLSYSVAGDGSLAIKPLGGEATMMAPVNVVGKAAYDSSDPYNTDYRLPNATTATKTDTPIMDTPVSIQVVPKAVLADKQSITLPDAVNGHVSGVLGRTGGGYLYDNFIIRGLAGSGFGDAYRNGLFNRQDVYDIANIEQVEIVKGPAAVLYGRIEPGGLVNYVTKKPLDTAYYSVQQQFGSYDQYRTLIDATGPLDADKTVLYRLNGSYLDSQSFREFVGNERYFVAPKLSWRPNEKFETNLELEYKRDRFNADFGIPAIDHRPAPIPITRTLKDGAQRQLMESKLVGFDWTYHFNDDWKITQRYLFKDWSLSGPTLFNFGGLREEDGHLFLDRTASKGVQDIMTHSGNIDLNGKFEILGSRHNLLIGVDGFHTTTESNSARAAVAGIDIFAPVYGQVDFNALPADNAFFYRKESWIGAYVQDQITLFDRLHILLGGRYDNVSTGGRFSPVSLAAAQAGRVKQEDNAFSPRAGVVYRAQDWLSLYGSYTESFSANNGLSGTGQRFDPQQGQQHEVGIKTESADRKFSSTLAFFHLTKSNLLTDDPHQADPNFQILAGKIRSKGIELDLAGQVTDQLHLLGTYAYTQANYIEDFDGLQGKRLENVPRHQGSLWGTWQFNDAFKAGLGVVTVGKRPGDSDNSYYMPGYVRLDAMAAYTQRFGQQRLTAQLNVNNLLDKRYYANSDGSSLGAIPGYPVNVMGSLKYEF
ncbi:TonB-dependent siderophore receptor [Methylomonas sp. UP202]|uniref:TonB-dependent siderophore receptor n=1 Tax=Methylomonas sp. UP202 TaxID=3040943 RepID=UPI002479CEB9|nr:TonB-dependent siderophore receptor [Methylomonas sp. UP202]WGS87482.1 TonB-dependent siderophore receptor [Methylomonas sp. UP202]